VFGLLLLFLVAGALVIILVTWRLFYSLTHPYRCTYAVAAARGLPTDPADLELDAREITIRFDDDTTTPCWLIEGDNHDPAAPIVILTHGWANGRYGVLPLARVYTPYARRVVIYDVRGQGESSARATTLGHRERDDLLTIMKHVQEPGERRPFVLAGSSLGAAITLLAADRLMTEANGERQVAGVILEGAFSRDMAPVKRRLRLMRMPAQPFVYLTQMLLDGTYMRGYGGYDGAALARRLRCPLLMIHGANDRICPIDEARAIAAAAADATFITIPDGHHSRLAEVGPKRYLDAIDAFMKKVGEESEEERATDEHGLTQIDENSELEETRKSPEDTKMIGRLD